MNNKNQRNIQPPRKGKKPKSSTIMYVIYSAIILALGAVMFLGEDSVPSREIRWGKLEEILLKHDYSKIKVVNREFAEIYIKKEALENDTAYNNLKAKNIFGKEAEVKEAFYVYKFVTFESFEKDLETIENQIIVSDTTGKNLTLAQKQQVINESRIDIVPETRSDVFVEVFRFLWPILFIVGIFVIMNMITRKQMGGGAGGGGSSFISGHTGCNAISPSSTASNIVHTGQSVHYSGYKFTNTVIIDSTGYNWTTVKGDYVGMPTHDGTGTMVGNAGGGYAKITLLELS